MTTNMPVRLLRLLNRRVLKETGVVEYHRWRIGDLPTEVVKALGWSVDDELRCEARNGELTLRRLNDEPTTAAPAAPRTRTRSRAPPAAPPSAETELRDAAEDLLGWLEVHLEHEPREARRLRDVLRNGRRPDR